MRKSNQLLPALVFHVKVRWTRRALRDMERAVDFIEEESPDAAARLAQKIWDATCRLGNFPKMGRLGRLSNTREWVVSGTPYIIVYRTGEDHISLLRVVHSSKRWPP